MFKQSQSQSTAFMKSFKKSSLIDIMGIKCAQCDLIYTHDKIQEHLIKHIQPKYLMPYQKNQGAKKLSSFLHLTQETLSLSSDIPSLNISQFPKQQSIRKNIRPPSDIGVIVHDLPQLKKDIISYRGDQKDLSSILDGDIQKQYFQHMTLTQNINLNQQSAQIRPQQISMYRSRMTGKLGQKSAMRSGKKVNPFDDQLTDKSKQYEIIPIFQGTKQIKQQPDRGLLIVNIKKHHESTPKREQIYTSAKKVRQTPQTDISYTPATVEGHSNQCRFCHGFYCQHCRSTIPPQYRPWNMQKQLDPKIIDFYKQHVYKGKCQDCEKNMR